MVTLDWNLVIVTVAGGEGDGEHDGCGDDFIIVTVADGEGSVSGCPWFVGETIVTDGDN